jgi:cellobiose phosphorylase
MTIDGAAAGTVSYETSRAAFLGRGRSVADPIALYRDALTDSEGSVLDPIVAIRGSVVLEPDEIARIHVATGVSETRDGALRMIEKYRDRQAADRVRELAWTHSQVVQRGLDASNLDTQLYERLASSVLYANPTLRAPRGLIARNQRGQSALWPYSISGDLPIVLVRIADVAHLALVRELVKAHAYWRIKGLAADLVIWNEDPSGYRQVLQDEIMAIIGSVTDPGLVDRPGGIFVRRSEQLSEEDKVLMQTVARVIVTDTGGTLAAHLDRRPRAERQASWLRGQPARAPAETIKAAVFFGRRTGHSKMGHIQLGGGQVGWALGLARGQGAAEEGELVAVFAAIVAGQVARVIPPLGGIRIVRAVIRGEDEFHRLEGPGK